MDEPQAEQLVETLDHCGAPRAAGGADTSQAWYQLRNLSGKAALLSFPPDQIRLAQWGAVEAQEGVALQIRPRGQPG